MIHFCFLTGLYSRRDPLIVERQGYSLVKEGFKVTYLLCDNRKEEVYEGIHILSTGFEPKNRLQRFFLTKRVLIKRALEIDADIYQVSDPELFSLVQPLKKNGKKVIFNLREYYPEMILNKSYIPSFARSIISQYCSRQMNRFLPLYDAVFTVTPQFVDLLRERHKTKKAYLLTNYPIPDYSFSLTKIEYMQRPNVLLYEGTIYSISRQEVLLDALSEVDDIKYVLAGKLEPGYETIKKHPYWNNVTFIDGFSKEQLKELFAHATISNIIRDFLGADGSLGVIKLFESMEAALPVLLADVPMYRQLIERYHCGLCVDPNDSHSIKKAIEFLVNHKEDAYQMGQNGRRAVLEQYNWDNQALLYLSVIKNIYNS